MLYIASKTSHQAVDSATRILMLDKLQEKGSIPLIRSARLNCYELALLGPDRVSELEQVMAAWTEESECLTYTRGDVFCFEDFALFLVFRDKESGLAGIRAGIVYEAETTEPLKKLDAFCRNVSDALEAARNAGQDAHISAGAAPAESQRLSIVEWQLHEPRAHTALARFAAERDADSSTENEEAGVEQLRAVELLEDVGARHFLRRIREAQTPVRLTDLLGSDENRTTESLINRMSDVGLLRREVLVSCRKAGRSLFRLPSTDALAVVTGSNAVCSECGTAIADEKIEELIVPTQTASTLLEDGSWLANRLGSVLRYLGIPEAETAVGPDSSDGEVRMMVNVCGEVFLLTFIDGDLTAAHARRALEKQTETGATHLVMIATQKIQDEEREHLREYAHRRTRGGSELEVVLIEGVETAASELRQAFERTAQKALAQELYALDANLGLSVGSLLATRFRLMRRFGALKDLAESAIGALAASSRQG
ncbi:MAG TPA: hypothetical protein VD966_05895 [Pyrinomonadaceae bacterium]|nr:hypothetical protein [Pyrinomonadaceae bacterium]